ncbi:Polyadenylate-binding protein 3 [Hibiscus syriacus]|uniref:Polyadenylate-binding protein 3 n=1 Tax=Hibiscus syriacus TaxID=106335 RepID=A0A6A3B984_HIBSY|nr:Polyadenylate-binding protein 3 [Hibiscus syriacus]
MQVDYSCALEEVQQHFQSCGTVNKVTIRSDKYGQPKGYAYVRFFEAEAVQEALLLIESELYGRQLKEGSKVDNGNAIQSLLLNTMDHSSSFKYF